MRYLGRDQLLSKRDGAQKKSADPQFGKNPPKPTAPPNIGSPKCASPDVPLSKPTEISNAGDESLQVLNGEETTQPDSHEMLESKQPPYAEDTEESSAVPQDVIEKCPALPQDTIGQNP